MDETLHKKAVFLHSRKFISNWDTAMIKKKERRTDDEKGCYLRSVFQR